MPSTSLVAKSASPGLLTETMLVPEIELGDARPSGCPCPA